MTIYLVIAVLYAAYGIKKHNKPHIAICLGLVWPVFLVIAALDAFAVKGANNIQTLDQCRTEIVNNIVSIRVVAANKTQGYSDPWSALLVDASMSLAAIEQRPESVPVMVSALMNVVGALAALTKAPDKETAALMLHLQKALATKTGRVTTRLIELHGHKVTDSERQEAEAFLDRLQWDGEQKGFVAKNA